MTQNPNARDDSKSSRNPFPELESAMRTIVNTPKAAVDAAIAKEHQKRAKPAKKK